jgi:hypothetical protein
MFENAFRRKCGHRWFPLFYGFCSSKLSEGKIAFYENVYTFLSKICMLLQFENNNVFRRIACRTFSSNSDIVR